MRKEGKIVSHQHSSPTTPIWASEYQSTYHESAIRVSPFLHRTIHESCPPAPSLPCRTSLNETLVESQYASLYRSHVLLISFHAANASAGRFGFTVAKASSALLKSQPTCSRHSFENLAVMLVCFCSSVTICCATSTLSPGGS